LPIELNSQLVAGAKHSVDSGCELLDEQVRTTDFLRPGSSPVEVVEELPVRPQSPEPARRRETQQQQHCRNKADCLKYCSRNGERLPVERHPDCEEEDYEVGAHKNDPEKPKADRRINKSG